MDIADRAQLSILIGIDNPRLYKYNQYKSKNSSMREAGELVRKKNEHR